MPTIMAMSEAFRPPALISPSEGASRVLRIRQSTGELKNWDAETTPYMVEPLDTTASPAHSAICFVGPARCGKTAALGDGWLAHSVCHDVGDTLIVQMTQNKARSFSMKRIDRMIRNSPAVKARMSPRKTHDNTYDKLTKSGNYINIAWPSASQLSSDDFARVFWTEYDRCDEDIDGEGSGFVIGSKRVQQAMSRGMAVFECSPGRDLEDPNWSPSTPHEGPPVTGIFSIYNNSDRRRWYWQCFECGDYFEAAPGLKLFYSLPNIVDLLEIVRTADISAMAQEHSRIACPHCGAVHEHDAKRRLNDIRTARWVGEGQSVDRDGNLIGSRKRSSIAGFWLGGVAAAYQSWESIVSGYLQGLREYAMSGSEATLKSKVNVDQAMAYVPLALIESAGDAAESRTEDIDRFRVPDWTRFLLCAVDVQGGTKARFVVQVHAIGVDMESAIIDRYDITESPRGQDIRIDPASYPEDWDALTSRVINATYQIEGDRELQVFHTIVDYGGEDGVSANAAAWRQRLRHGGMANRVTLAKGDGHQKEAVQLSNARDKRGRKMRDVPLLMFSSDQFKDQIAASMRRREPGPTYMHFPAWLKQWFFDELRAEIRQPNGKWKKIRARNEALDCWAMIWALAYFLGPADPRRPFNWKSPPAWAAPMESNSQSISSGERRVMATNATPRAMAGLGSQQRMRRPMIR
jgi:phage terminase large subunit GpA-like protein